MTPSDHTRGPLLRRLLLVVAIIAAPVGLALASEQLAATAQAPVIDRAPIRVELSGTAPDPTRSSTPTPTVSEVPADPEGDDD